MRPHTPSQHWKRSLECILRKYKWRRNSYYSPCPVCNPVMKGGRSKLLPVSSSRLESTAIDKANQSKWEEDLEERTLQVRIMRFSSSDGGVVGIGLLARRTGYPFLPKHCTLVIRKDCGKSSYSLSVRNPILEWMQGGLCILTGPCAPLWRTLSSRFLSIPS